jgi:hypothetical protein
MHGFIKRFADGVFFPEEEEILVAAFDDAWAKLQSSRAPFAEEAYAPAAQEILAKRIIMAAQRGERNPRQLTDDALLHLSRQRLSEAASLGHLNASHPVDAPPLDAVGGKPTREPRIRLRSQRSERL